MRQRIVVFFQSALLALAVMMSFAAVVPLTEAVAAAPTSTADCNAVRFLTFKPWYYGLSQYDVNSQSCTIASPSAGQTAVSNFVWHIALNVLGILVQVVGYIAVIMIIVGGFQFLANGDSPEAVKKARTTILNAIIGLVISIAATAIVNLILRLING